MNAIVPSVQDADNVADRAARLSHGNPLMEKRGVGRNEAPYSPHHAWVIQGVLFVDLD